MKSILQGINRAILYCQILFLILLFILILNIFYSLISDDDSGLLTAGVLSGGLHALTGADHLAALLPSIVGKKWWIAFSLGCVWGLGHSCSSSLMATCGYFLEDSVLRFTFMSYVIKYADFAIGLTLLVIGYIGIVESTQIHVSQSEVDADQVIINHPSNAPSMIFESFPSRSLSPYLCMAKLVAVFSTIFLNGLFLGLSWDGLPSLAPALSADSWHGLVIFLLAYGIGTMVSMAVASGMLALCASWLGCYTHDAIPRRLAFVSSIVAIVFGGGWIVQAVLQLWTSYDILQIVKMATNPLLNDYAPLLVVVIILCVATSASLIRSNNKVATSLDLLSKANIHIV